MKNLSNERGVAFFWVMILALLVFPLAWLFVTRVSQEIKFSTRDKQAKGARHLADSMAADLMKQMSEDYQISKLDARHLLRPNAFSFGASAGRLYFSDPVPNRTRRLVHVVAEGEFGAQVDHVNGGYAREALNKQRTRALVQFHNDWLRFAHIIQAEDYEMNADNVFTNIVFPAPEPELGDVDAGVYARGRRFVLSGSAGAVTYNSNRPLYIRQDARIGPHAHVTAGAPVYHGGALNVLPNASVAGGSNDFVPNFEPRLPPFDLAWYGDHSHFKTTVSETWVFHFPNPANPGATGPNDTGVIEVKSSANPARNGTRFRLPSYADQADHGDHGAILVAENAHIILEGDPTDAGEGVAGRVTIVSIGNPGTVQIQGNFSYAGANLATGGGCAAQWERSIAVLASNQIAFTADAGEDQTVSGFYYSNSPNVQSVFLQGGGPGTRFRLHGALVGAVSAAFTPPPVREIWFDQNLYRYRPPGLPEVPSLLLWKKDSAAAPAH